MYKAPVVVSARKETPNFLIGVDFLAAHGCGLSLLHKLFTVGVHKTECIPERVKVIPS